MIARSTLLIEGVYEHHALARVGRLRSSIGIVICSIHRERCIEQLAAVHLGITTSTLLIEGAKRKLAAVPLGIAITTIQVAGCTVFLVDVLDETRSSAFVSPEGLEPSTLGLKGRCSTT